VDLDERLPPAVEELRTADKATDQVLATLTQPA
jgi:hypothetical protein